MEIASSKFVSKLNDNEIKELIAYCLTEYDMKHLTHNMALFNSMDDIKYRFFGLDESRNYPKEYAVIEFALDSRFNRIIQPTDILINDYSMILIEAPFSLKFSNMDYVLQMYLTNKFGNEYTNELFNKRVMDAEIERKKLNSISSNFIKDISSKIEKDKTQKQKNLFRRRV